MQTNLNENQLKLKNLGSALDMDMASKESANLNIESREPLEMSNREARSNSTKLV